MFVMRLVLERMMYYFAEFDLHPEKPGHDAAYWTMLGNKIQSFVDEESGCRAMEKLQDGFFHYLVWDDSEAKIAGTGYKPAEVDMSDSWEIQLVDLTDMIVARRFKAITFPRTK